MIDEDARDLAIHELIDNLVEKIATTNNWTRRQVFDRFECFIEAEVEEEEQAARKPASISSATKMTGCTPLSTQT